MPRVFIGFVHRPVRSVRHCVGIVLESTPEVRHHAIQIVDRLNPRLCRPAQQHRPATKERLNVVRNVAESLPHEFGNLRFATETTEKVPLEL
jgi:hypothetical protein